MWTQYTVEQALAQQERMLAEAAKARLLKLLPQTQWNPWQKAARPALIVAGLVLLVRRIRKRRTTARQADTGTAERGLLSQF